VEELALPIGWAGTRHGPSWIRAPAKDVAACPAAALIDAQPPLAVHGVEIGRRIRMRSMRARDVTQLAERGRACGEVMVGVDVGLVRKEGTGADFSVVDAVHGAGWPG
jgi:hypothetical protein